MSVAFNSDVSLTVEIAFDSNPLDTSQTYTDVSAYVRSFSTNRGRQHALDEFQTGTLRVVLDNRDDRFNPLNTSSPYYDSANSVSKIKPFKRIRVKAEYSSTTYFIFSGFINAYPESFGGQGSDSVVQLQCVDAFKMFNLNTIGSRAWLIGRRSSLGENTKLGYADSTEKSSLRIGRLLDAFGWSSSERTISTGDLDVITQNVDTNMLTALKAVESAEQGQLFMGADGKVVFRDRNFKRTQQFTSQGTFGNGVGELPFSDVITSFDESRIFNQISVTRTGGTTQEAESLSSIEEYGARPQDLTDTLNVSDLDASQIALQRLAQFQDTSPRVEGLVVNPLVETNLWLQVLGRELGDKITVNIPTPASTTMNFDIHIESISHTVDADNQTWSWNISTSAGSEVGAWVLGSSKIGQDTFLAW